MAPESPVFSQFNLIVRDMEKTVAFYRGLGWPLKRSRDSSISMCRSATGCRRTWVPHPAIPERIT